MVMSPNGVSTLPEFVEPDPPAPEELPEPGTEGLEGGLGLIIGSGARQGALEQDGAVS